MWYAPITLIQSCLEVDTASICASIPVFWPVLVAKLDQISVTREIIITREESGFELCKSSSDGHQGSSHSRAGSEIHLNGDSAQKMATHYNDMYVLDQVDPLRTDKTVGVESKVTVGPLDGSLERKPSRTLYLKRL
jgi:hypothetical protein